MKTGRRPDFSYTWGQAEVECEQFAVFSTDCECLEVKKSGRPVSADAGELEQCPDSALNLNLEGCCCFFLSTGQKK